MAGEKRSRHFSSGYQRVQSDSGVLGALPGDSGWFDGRATRIERVRVAVPDPRGRVRRGAVAFRPSLSGIGLADRLDLDRLGLPRLRDLDEPGTTRPHRTAGQHALGFEPGSSPLGN